MQVVRRINRGGFGYVDEVATSDGSRLARKCFDPQIKNETELDNLNRRFQREVRIQSAISHPNIMPIAGSDLAASPPWFLMPLATKSLEEHIQDGHRAGTFDTSPWPDVLAAVEELHRLGYVHRDLKPANILLVDGRWVLSDFGLILPTMRDTTVLTGSRSAYGTREYAAPEQAQDFRNTPEQADIYALGCILHDMLETTPRRIPFAQIRTTGPYAPLLERCTEVDYRRRISTIAALRGALFELWRTTSFTPPPRDDAEILQHVLDNPDGIEGWQRLVSHLESLELGARDPLHRAFSAELLLKLHALDEVLFSRVVGSLCAWTSNTGFEWSYCDVVGDRLLEAYRVATVRLKCEIVLSVLELAVSHNRWHVMRQAGGMLSTAADNGLVDRVLIEMTLDSRIEAKLRRIESIIQWHRTHWHERIASKLNESDSRGT